MADLSYDWVWAFEARETFLGLSERERSALSLRIAFLSQNAWPDWSSKRFVNDLPLDRLMALAQMGENYHFILYADDDWAIVYEVVQPWVFVIYNITPL